MAEYVICEKSELTAVADAIRTRTDSTDTMKVGDMVAQIGEISGGADADIPIVGDGSAAVAHYQLDLSTVYPTGIAPYTLTLTCGNNTLTGTYSTTADKFVYALPTTGTWHGNLVDSSSEVNIDFSFDIAPYIYKKKIREGGSRVLANDSWEIISEISKSGNPEMYYNIGDEKDITLTTGEVITL